MCVCVCANMCVDLVAAMHAKCMTCVTIVCSLWLLMDIYSSLSMMQNGLTSLMAASSYGHVDVVRTLIMAHAHINQRTEVV